MHPRPSWPFSGGLAVQAGKLSVPIINSAESSADLFVAARVAEILEGERYLFAGIGDVALDGRLVTGLGAPGARHPLANHGEADFECAQDVHVIAGSEADR